MKTFENNKIQEGLHQDSQDSGIWSDSRNQKPENSKVPFRKSEFPKENVNPCLQTFYLSHRELLMNEFIPVLN